MMRVPRDAPGQQSCLIPVEPETVAGLKRAAPVTGVEKLRGHTDLKGA